MSICARRGERRAVKRGGAFCRPDEMRDMELGRYSGRERPPSLIARMDPAVARGSFTPRQSGVSFVPALWWRIAPRSRSDPRPEHAQIVSW